MNMTENELAHVIGCRPKVAGYVNSGENVKIVEGYVLLNFEVVALVVSEIFQKTSCHDDGGGGGGRHR